MLKKIKCADLEIGMYINLGESWMRHSFFRPAFKITSVKQIKKIAAAGFRSVMVDPDRSDPAVRSKLGEGQPVNGDSQDLPMIEVPDENEFDPMEQISDELVAAIEDPAIPPEKKAEIVYSHSIRMMDNILQEPSPENILKGKTMIYATVDHILADDETADHLSQITSHDYYTYTHSVNVGLLSVLL
ncbi:MAG: DUF3391 domain-containing protein, partial [Candidatus Marinimicrobia bacterium]|nr:DUF3391 domain-containing protein [Candidatus Neomarinimicrobiota bacterium]